MNKFCTNCGQPLESKMNNCPNCGKRINRNTKTKKENITVVGILPFLNEGDFAEFTGKFIVHPTYGQQFSVETFERKTPENSAAILRYLSAGALKGIGPATALKIEV